MEVAAYPVLTKIHSSPETLIYLSQPHTQVVCVKVVRNQDVFVTEIGILAYLEQHQEDPRVALPVMLHQGSGFRDGMMYYYLVMPDYGYSLSYVTQKLEFSLDLVNQTMREISQTVKFLHEHLIAHRDIKLDNILMNREKRFILIDYGLAVSVDSTSPFLAKPKEIKGTPRYICPEVWLQTCQDLRSQDIFSLGCVYFYLINRNHLFPGTDLMDIRRNILQGTFRLNDSFECPLVAAMVAPEANRMSIQGVLDHFLALP